MELLLLAPVLVVGLCIGSFLNVLIYRLPLQLQHAWESDSRDFLGIEPAEASRTRRFNIAYPPSRCPKCNQALKAYHNIPVLSYLFLRGRCAFCSESISIQYPLVELVSAALCVFVVQHFGLTVSAALVLVFTLILITLTGIDLKTQLLPDILTYPLLWTGLLANTRHLFSDLESAVIGAALGYLSLWSVYWLFKLVTGKEGMGHGDFKLLAALGAWLGWQMLPLIILLSSLIGALVGGIMVFFAGRDKQVPLAFGPYLAIGGWVALMWGADIVKTYLSYLG